MLSNIGTKIEIYIAHMAIILIYRLNIKIVKLKLNIKVIHDTYFIFNIDMLPIL